jgi:hypothetical protein
MLGMIGGVVSAIGSMAAANAQAAGMKSEAEWKEREAAVNQMETSYEIANKKREATIALGAQNAQYAGAGIDTAGGTPLQVGLATNQESGMDIQKARIQGKEFQLKALAEAKNLRAQAKAAKTAGMFGAISSVISGVGSMVGGVTGGGTSLIGSAFSANPVGKAQMSPVVAPYPNVSGGGIVNAPRLSFGGPR